MASFKVLLVPPRIGDDGGVEAHTMHLAEHLSNLGASVEVVCADEKSGSVSLPRSVSLRLLPTAFKIQNTNITPSLPFLLAKTDADIIHAMVPTPWSSDLAVIAARLRRKKAVVTIHSDLFAPSFFGGIITKVYVETFYRLLLSLADRVVIVNPDYKKTFVHTRHVLEKFEKKISFLPNGVDTSMFYPMKRKKSGRQVLFVSVLDEFHEFKGLAYLLEAAKLVAREVSDAKFTIVGGGPLKEKYQKLANEIGVAKSVSFVGAKSNRELPPLYASSDVFVLPSINTESFGIVLLESMACGTPVVATEYAGMKERIVKERCGFIVPSKNSSSLASAIIVLLKDRKLREEMGSNSVKLVEQHYEWEMVAKQTMDLYNEVLKGGDKE